MPLIELTKPNIQVQMQLTHTDILPLDQLRSQVMELAGQVLQAWIKAQQEHRLQQLLGGRWKRHSDDQIGIGCPDCGSIALRRKSWSSRTVTMADFGEVPVARRRLSCTACGHTWMPFKSALRAPNGRYGPQVIARSIDRLLHTSYQKAANQDPQGPSAATLHRTVSQYQPPGPPPAAATVVSDATRLPRWRSSGQISISLAHQIGPAAAPKDPNTPPPPRPRSVVAVTAGREADLLEALEPVRITSLVHDGKLAGEDLAEYPGRCYWHVPYTVRYLLYQNKITGEDNRQRVETLREAITGIYHSGALLEQQLTGWMADNEDAPTACTHVAGSMEALKRMAEHPEKFTVRTTSHLEREMVEINKRFENGGGWTPKGAKKLGWLHQLYRFEPERYHQTKQQLVEQTVFPT